MTGEQRDGLVGEPVSGRTDEPEGGPMFDDFEFTEVPARGSKSPALLIAVLSVAVAIVLTATAVIGFRTFFRVTAQGACLLVVQCVDVPAAEVESRADVTIPDDARPVSAVATDDATSQTLSAVLVLGDAPLYVPTGYLEVDDFATRARISDKLTQLGFDSVDTVFQDDSVFGTDAYGTIAFGRSADGEKLAAIALRQVP